MTSLGLGLLRGENGAYLLHQAQSVPVLPLLDYLAPFNTMDSYPSDSHLIVRGSDPHQFALVGSPSRPTASNLVPSGISSSSVMLRSVKAERIVETNRVKPSIP